MSETASRARRAIMIAAAALFLAACGDGKKYAVPATEATRLLAGLAHNPAVSPLPAPLLKVSTRFEALADRRSVQWAFIGDEGQDLGRIIATIEPEGEQSSRISIDYRKGAAPGGRWMTDQVRAQIEAHMPRLLAEAIESSLERRPFDMALRGQVEEDIRAGLIATMFQGIHSELKKSIEETDAKSKVWDAERKAQANREANRRQAPPSQDAGKPTTDLSRFN